MTDDDLLFHYTNGQGLVGILTSGVLWATDIRFLNDGSELLYGASLLRDAATGLGGQTKRGIGFFRALERCNIHVACFCAERDLLSQWRAYGEFGSGYAIGFRRSWLVEACAQAPYPDGEYPARLHEVEYDSPTLAARATQIMEAAFALPLAQKEAAAPGIAEFLTTAKDSGFVEEHEWRIVRWLGNRDVRFRVSRGIPTPYSEFPLWRGSDKKLDTKALAKVVLGPSRTGDLGTKSVEKLLSTLDLSGVSVEKSCIPFR
jgi:hypothetical protein